MTMSDRTLVERARRILGCDRRGCRWEYGVDGGFIHNGQTVPLSIEQEAGAAISRLHWAEDAVERERVRAILYREHALVGCD